MPDLRRRLFDRDYSPAFQDEYQRLWHEAAERLRRVEAVLADPVVTYSLNDGEQPLTPMMTETEAIRTAIGLSRPETAMRDGDYPTDVWDEAMRVVDEQYGSAIEFDPCPEQRRYEYALEAERSLSRPVTEK